MSAPPGRPKAPTRPLGGQRVKRAGGSSFAESTERRDDFADIPGEARDFVSLVVEAYAQCFQTTKSRGDARRLVEGGSVQWCGAKIPDVKAVLPEGESGVLKLDKIRAVRIS